MFAVSPPKVLNIAIHNQHPNLELTSPVYYSTNTTYCVPPEQQVDTGTIMEASFGMYFNQIRLRGALLYKLQRKHASRTDNQPNNSTVFIEDTATNIYLLVIWYIGDWCHKVCVCLIEFPRNFTCDEDKLWALYKEYDKYIYENYKADMFTWLVHDSTVMKIRSEVTYGSGCKLDIIIFEGTGGHYMERPMKIDPERLVLPLSMLIVLMYGSSLPIQPSVKLNIHNQCLNIDLVSPIYVTNYGLECYRAPDDNVHAGDIMRSGFIINKYSNESFGTLIYRLQRRQLHEYTMINEYMSSVAQLLVTWRVSEFKELYADVLLVEHDKKFDWNKDNLMDLYRRNINQFRQYSHTVIDTWLSDANTALMTTFEVMDEELILNITISEAERDNNTRIPICIDPKK
jgi:hypothetical protein